MHLGPCFPPDCCLFLPFFPTLKPTYTLTLFPAPSNSHLAHPRACNCTSCLPPSFHTPRPSPTLDFCPVRPVHHAHAHPSAQHFTCSDFIGSTLGSTFCHAAPRSEHPSLVVPHASCPTSTLPVWPPLLAIFTGKALLLENVHPACKCIFTPHVMHQPLHWAHKWGMRAWCLAFPPVHVARVALPLLPLPD